MGRREGDQKVQNTNNFWLVAAMRSGGKLFPTIYAVVFTVLFAGCAAIGKEIDTAAHRMVTAAQYSMGSLSDPSFQADATVQTDTSKTSSVTSSYRATEPTGAGGLVTDRYRIRAVQRKLQRLGYIPGGVDGVYGNQTRTALIHFQDDEGLYPANGKLSETTYSTLLDK